MKLRSSHWISAAGLTVLTGWCWAVLFSHMQWETPEPPRIQGEALVHKADGGVEHRPGVLEAAVRETENTWSNLAYVCFGLALGMRAASTAGRLLGLALVGLGWGSGFYHASIMPAWRLLDVIGMYWVIFALVTYGVGRIVPQVRAEGWKAAWLGLAVAVAAGLTAIHRNDVRLGGVKLFDSTTVVVSGFVLVGLLMAWSVVRAGPTKRGLALSWAAGSLVCGGIAAAFQLGDRVGSYLFSPSAMIQGHTVWHLLSAVAVGLAYEVFREGWGDASLFHRTPVGIDIRP